jgi:hypothetical protein
MSRNVGEPGLYEAYFVLRTEPFTVTTCPIIREAELQLTAPAQDAVEELVPAELDATNGTRTRAAATAVVTSRRVDFIRYCSDLVG